METKNEVEKVYEALIDWSNESSEYIPPKEYLRRVFETQYSEAVAESVITAINNSKLDATKEEVLEESVRLVEDFRKPIDYDYDDYEDCEDFSSSFLRNPSWKNFGVDLCAMSVCVCLICVFFVSEGVDKVCSFFKHIFKNGK